MRPAHTQGGYSSTVPLLPRSRDAFYLECATHLPEVAPLGSSFRPRVVQQSECHAENLKKFPSDPHGFIYVLSRRCLVCTIQQFCMHIEFYPVKAHFSDA